MASKDFIRGDKVYAKWPDTNLWFAAQVQGRGDGDSMFTVKFDEGSVFDLSSKYIAVSRFVLWLCCSMLLRLGLNNE